jgi:hypothetical protein
VRATRTRTRAAALALWIGLGGLAALAACSAPASEVCPGEPLASLTLEGVRDDASTGCVAPPAGGWAAPATLPAFPASFRWDTAANALAYCAGGPHGAVLLGTRSGDHLRAEVTVPGAVLGACAATCRPLTTVVIEGDLAGGGADPVTFAGALTETYDGGDGPCGDCVLPCTSRYVVTGVER